MRDQDMGVESGAGVKRRRDGRTTSSAQAWTILGCGIAVVVVYGAKIDTPWEGPLFLVGAACGMLMSTLGALRAPRARRRIWWAFAAGQGCFLLGESLRVYLEYVLPVVPHPSAADAAFLAGYPGLALGMLWLVRGRRRGRERAAFLDAAILTTGISVAGIVFVVGPAARAGGTTLLSQTVAAAYPVGDLLVLALVVRMLTAGIVRNTAVWALFGSAATLLLADIHYVLGVAAGTPYPAWTPMVYLASYLLLGFAALHPSADSLSEPVPDRPDRITVVRLAWLGSGLVVAPAAEQAADLLSIRHNGVVVLLGGALAALLIVMRLWDLVKELQRTAVQLAALARRDGLTGVANRRTWDHELSRACAHAREHDEQLWVGLLDMDNFKLFNDTHGHLTGDLALKETSAAWSSIVEGRGFLARFGGEEFTVLLPMTAGDAHGIAERMRRAVSHSQTCSIGLAEWDRAETPAQLLSRADAALYRAKHAGRDRVAIHDGTASQVVHLAVEPDPVAASLRAVYQPIIDLRSGGVIGAEALSRFDGANPQDVFDRAASDGTEVALTVRALQTARDGWTGRGRLALNVSLTALTAPEVQAALPQDLSHIVLEITEGDLVTYTPEVMLVVESLRGRGAQIAIDDFGTGFSNIRRLAMIRPDILKLDMTLIRDIDKDDMLQAVTASCVHWASLTDSAVVAEGIETEAELAELTRLGVSHGQGYLLGRPGPMEDLAAAQGLPAR